MALGNARLKVSSGAKLDRYERSLLANGAQPLMLAFRKNRADLAQAKSSCVFHIEGDPKLTEFRRDRDFTPEADTLTYKRFDPEAGTMDEITDDEIDRSINWKSMLR